MVEDGDAICASLLQLRNAFWPKPTKMACQNAVSATFLARDAVNADFLAVEGCIEMRLYATVSIS